MVLPLGWLAWLSVAGERGPTLAHYARVFGDVPLRRAVWNTIVLAFWSGAASVAVGAPLAWLTARTDLPWARALRALTLASFVTPPFLGAFAWVMLAGPNAGLLNRTWRGLTGGEAPLVNIFTMPGLIFVVALYTFPYVYVIIANTLELVASDLEEAGAILGAGRLTVALTITLPLVAPAIASGFVLSVLQALALFGSPAILALPAGFHTITTQIWSFFQYPPKVEMAAAFSMPLLVATALLLWLQRRVLGRRGYAAVGGRGGQRRRIALGAWRYPALAGCLLVMTCSVFLPYGVLAKAAFARAWAQPLTWDNLTLANWTFTFLEYSSTRDAIVNTMELAVLTATAGAVLAALLAYVTNRRLVRGSQALGFLAVAPVVVPGVVFAVALFIAYTRPPLVLYGTLAILFVAYLTKEMPVGYAQSDATFKAIQPDLEEAGRILGAGRLRVLREITAPLARGGIIAAWCFVFIGVIRELSASIILFTPNTKVMSVVMFDLKEEGQFGAIAVLGLFMLAMTLATVAFVQRVAGRDVLGARE
ncbi:MAG: iron ABC transporter permease [Candidatus Rokubacteria bacterium]|nr:iron ABC transporter permease [Candidatus Rokubacteria bacterium]MBI3826556.1 iron ABC transporter permease [Candidatus Rokubacteria bacterium]